MDQPTEGKITCTVDYWSGAAQLHSSPVTVIEMNTEYTNILNKHLNAPGVIDLTKLCVIPKKQVWCIYVDIIILNHSAGAVLDMCTLVTYAALRDTKLPKLRLIKTEQEGEYDIELDDDPYAFTPFPYEAIPLTITLYQLGDYCIVDADNVEEYCSTARMIIAINQQGNVCTVSSNGVAGIKPSSLHSAIEAARTLAPLLYERITSALQKPTQTSSSSSSSVLTNGTAASLESLLSLSTGSTIKNSKLTSLGNSSTTINEGIITSELLHSRNGGTSMNIITNQNLVTLPQQQQQLTSLKKNI